MLSSKAQLDFVCTSGRQSWEQLKSSAFFSIPSKLFCFFFLSLESFSGVGAWLHTLITCPHRHHHLLYCLLIELTQKLWPTLDSPPLPIKHQVHHFNINIHWCLFIDTQTCLGVYQAIQNKHSAWVILYNSQVLDYKWREILSLSYKPITPWHSTPPWNNDGHLISPSWLTTSTTITNPYFQLAAGGGGMMMMKANEGETSKVVKNWAQEKPCPLWADCMTWT